MVTSFSPPMVPSKPKKKRKVSPWRRKRSMRMS